MGRCLGIPEAAHRILLSMGDLRNVSSFKKRNYRVSGKPNRKMAEGTAILMGFRIASEVSGKVLIYARCDDPGA